MKPTVAERIKKRLGEFTRDLESGKVIQEKYTCRRIVMDLKPLPYSPKAVKETRNLLNVSQAVFAMFLGVSTKSVQSWEAGKPPPKMACRFMDEIQRNPKYWRDRLNESILMK